MFTMNKTASVIFFLIVLLADLVVMYTNHEVFRYITKPLLMPLLIVFFITGTRFVTSSLKKMGDPCTWFFMVR